MSEFKGVCIDCGSPELYSNSEIRQPRMCVDCYAAMIGFTRVEDSFVDSDMLGDDSYKGFYVLRGANEDT